MQKARDQTIFLEIGTIANIHQMMRVPDGSMRLAVQGIDRMRILEVIQEEPYLVARVRRDPEEIEDSVEVQALGRNTVDLFQRLVALVPHLARRIGHCGPQCR